MGNDYKVADITLSDFGRREISLAENEMPALMALREKYKDDQSVKTEDIVDIDFICPEGDIVSAVNGNMFDYVVASHVFEHSPRSVSF